MSSNTEIMADATRPSYAFLGSEPTKWFVRPSYLVTAAADDVAYPVQLHHDESGVPDALFSCLVALLCKKEDC